VVALLAVVPALKAANSSSAVTGKRPNVVIILADDMGFSDLGCFGSEIKTPNLDSLAKAGLRCTQFYTSASCSPTRSMLLSGVDTHLNGLGAMDEWAAPNQWGKPGYEGDLNRRVTTLPQVLKDAGYHTYMVGKWHLGKDPDHFPAARGFERDFALLDGAGSYWDMSSFTAANPKSTFTEDGRYLKKLPKDYYATKTYTDKVISFIEEGRKDGKPFFAYVSHQAPPRPVSSAARLAQPPRGRIRQGLGRGPQGAAAAPDRNGPRAQGHSVGRAHVVHPRGHPARGRSARPSGQEDGVVCRHGGKHGLPHRAAD
jgi:arylsulfatase